MDAGTGQAVAQKWRAGGGWIWHYLQVCGWDRLPTRNGCPDLVQVGWVDLVRGWANRAGGYYSDADSNSDTYTKPIADGVPHPYTDAVTYTCSVAHSGFSRVRVQAVSVAI